MGNRRIQNQERQRGNSQKSNHRIKQNRLGALHLRRQKAQKPFHQLHHIARQKSRKQRAEETASPASGQSPRDKTDHQTGTVGNAFRDIAGKDGKHKTKRHASRFFLEKVCGGGILSERGSRTVRRENGVDKIGHSNQQTTANHKRQHMGNAIHHMAVNRMRNPLYAVLSERSPSLIVLHLA